MLERLEMAADRQLAHAARWQRQGIEGKAVAEELRAGVAAMPPDAPFFEHPDLEAIGCVLEKLEAMVAGAESEHRTRLPEVARA